MAPHISIGILAWNEEEHLKAMLESLFRQSLFFNLCQSDLTCEILLVANGCADQTEAIAARLFDELTRTHRFREMFSCRMVSLRERGKMNAWNQFVHQLSAREAEFLFLADADIVLLKPDTLWNMYSTLVENPEAKVAVDQPVKDVAFKNKKNLLDHISLATSAMAQADGVQLTGQLYCIRAATARDIYLPRDLILDDGFIKTLVCTDFLTRPSNPERIVQADNAAHRFEAYLSTATVLRNQKRQMIGQAIVHVLVDEELRGTPPATMGEELRRRETDDPLWLQRLMTEHVRRTKFFWRLFPGLLTFRFRRLANISGARKIPYSPAALIGFFVTLISCWQAHRFFKHGFDDNYWPSMKRINRRTTHQGSTATAVARPALQH